MSHETYDFVAIAENAGVTIKSYDHQTIETEFTVYRDAIWSWDRPGSAGGCGLPSQQSAAFDAVRELRLPLRCACGARGVAMDACIEFECGAELSCDGFVEQKCRNNDS